MHVFETVGGILDKTCVETRRAYKLYTVDFLAATGNSANHPSTAYPCQYMYWENRLYCGPGFLIFTFLAEQRKLLVALFVRLSSQSNLTLDFLKLVMTEALLKADLSL